MPSSTSGSADVAAPSPAVRPYTAPKSEIWGWGIGRIAEFGLIATFGQAMTIFTVGFGLSPVIVSWCMMLPRLVDGFVDPIIGHWSDNTHTRWGRRKPFIVGGALVGAFFLTILWWASPTWSPTTQFLYLGLVGMALYLCYGAYAMAWNAIGYELSDDYHERSKISAIGGFFLAAMGLGLSWMYWLALRPIFGNVISGMRWIGAGMSVAIVISAIICARMIRERFSQGNRSHVALLPAIRATLKNRPFIVLLVMKIFEIFGGRLVGGMSFYLMVYYVCRGDQDLATRLGGFGATLGTIWSFSMLPLVKPASQWIGKRGAMIAGSVVSFLAAVVAPFITTPVHPYWGLIPGLIIAPLLVISSTIAGAILPDICDVDELEHGERREGLYTSVMGFVGKLEISLAVVLVGYVITGAGIDTSIALRWGRPIEPNEGNVTLCTPGESAVYRLDDSAPALFDTFTVTGHWPSIELAAGDQSPTDGFKPINAHAKKTDSGSILTFNATSARYLQVTLIRGFPDVRAQTLRSLRLTSSQHPNENLLSPPHATLVAARPPEAVVARLYWLVMIPAIFFSGLTMLATFFFPLTEKRMAEVRRELDIRRASRQVL